MPGKTASTSSAALNTSQKIVSSICTLASRTRRKTNPAVSRLPTIKHTRISVWSNISQAPFGVGGLGVALAEPLDQQDRNRHLDHILDAVPKIQVALPGRALAHLDLDLFDARAVFDQVADGV